MMTSATQWTGTVTTGEGRAAGFTGIDWVREGFTRQFGIDPSPGTLNLTVDPATAEHVDSVATDAISEPGSTACAAKGLAVQIRCPHDGNAVPAAIVRPDVPDYPSTKLELIAAVDLRDTLKVSDGTALSLAPCASLDVDAAVFDLDGTLVNSLDAYFQVARVAARSRGRDVTREFVRSTLDANNHAFWELVFTEDEPDRNQSIQAARLTARDAWPDIQREHVTSIRGIDSMLETLSNRGIRIGIVTAGNASTITPLEQSGSRDLIECVITKADVKNPKPDPQGLRLAMEKLAASPERTLYVGDSRVDIQTAHAAGARGIGVLTGAGTPQTLANERPLRVLSSLDALPDMIASS